MVCCGAWKFYDRRGREAAVFLVSLARGVSEKAFLAKSMMVRTGRFFSLAIVTQSRNSGETLDSPFPKSAIFILTGFPNTRMV